MLHDSAESWSRGDLDGFLDDYAPDAVLAGGRILRGRDRIRESYLDSYWRGGQPEHGLRFRGLETRLVGEGAAVVLGRYELFDRSSGETAQSGTFSLTLEWSNGRWWIIHDHSSADG